MGRLLIIGEGQLYERLAPLLSETPAPEGAALHLFLSDAPTPTAWSEQQAASLAQGAAFLPIWLDGNELILGPWVTPGEPGCLRCAEIRRHAVHPQKERAPLLAQAAAWTLAQRKQNPRLSPHAVAVAAALGQEAIAAWQRGERPGLQGAVTILPLDTLLASRHRFLPVPTCPACGALPLDTAEAVEPPTTPRPKAERSSFRHAERPLESERLRAEFVDRRTGLIANEIRLFDNDLLALAAAELALDFRSEREPGIGRSLSFAESDFTGLLEALERYGGVRPLAKRTAVHSSYAELGERAIDPAAFILHSPEQYDLPQFPFARYQPDLRVHWVWGYSFQRQAAALVPEQLAYYRLLDLNKEGNHRNLFAYEISNGCALGGCLEEAVLHGLFEAAERDGFLLTWYAQLPVPRIDLTRIAHPAIGLLLDRLDARGFDVHAFNITFDFGIPAVWVMAVNRQNGGMKSFSAAGAHLDPVKAVVSGLVELTAGVFDFSRLYPQERERILPMVAEPNRVRSMRDHALLYCLPEAFERFAFLLGSDRPAQSLEEAFPAWFSDGPKDDLTADLWACADRVIAAGCDLVVVDQTPPEQRPFGLRTVKVLVPGSLTMTFGHQLRRLEGATRLQRVPHQFGYQAPGDRINPHPHPFP